MASGKARGVSPQSGRRIGGAPGRLAEVCRRLRPHLFQESGRHARAAADPAGNCRQTDISMHTTHINPYQDVRPVPGSRQSTHAASAAAGAVVARGMPILPRGWAPLTADQQRAVLEACDASPDAMVFRIGSVSDPQAEYRVYRLENESWAGLWLASECWTDCDGAVANRILLGIGNDAAPVFRIALDVVNRDLEARGEPCRLGVDLPVVSPADPRRI
jgi:hypothetical protein